MTMNGLRTFKLLALVAVASAGVLFSGISWATTATKPLLIKVRIDKAAKLIVDTDTITFPNVAADEANQIPALQNDIKVTVKARTGSMSPVNLHIIADGDLVSGPDRIPIQNVTWHASGSGFLGGTLSKAISQKAGSWTGSGIRQGTFRYYLNNGWDYQKGNYQVTITYTLTTP
jgi:hypothetical protein